MNLLRKTGILTGALLLLVVCTPLPAQTNEAYYKKILIKADSLARGGNMQEAVMAYRQALVFNNHSMEACLGLARIYEKSGKHDEAKKWFRKVLEIDPENSEALNFFNDPELIQKTAQADSLLGKRKHKDAEKLYKEILKKNNAYIPALMGLGKIGFRRKKYKDVKKWFRKVLQIAPENEEAQLYLLRNPDPRIDGILEKAQAYRDKGDLKKAVKAYKKALKVYEGCYQAFRGLAEIAFEKKDYGDVKDWYGKILEILPNDLDANYSRGVAYRETGKTKNYLIKKIQFGKSRKYLDKTIELDSTFKDVYYQRALLERYKENWIAALDFAKKQLRVHPDDFKSTVGLFKLYRLFIFHSTNSKVETYLRNHRDDWTNLILAENYRHRKKFKKAEAFYAMALQNPGSLDSVLVELSLLRLYVEEKNYQAAGECFNRAMQKMNSDLDAQFMFEDTKYIFTDLELQIFEHLQDAKLKREFFEKFWTERDPTPASLTNLRAIEHYRRLVFAERSFWYDGVKFWGNSPDKMSYLKFPRVYYLNEEFNDKGLIYIRHGPPNDFAVTPSASVSNESWHYYKRADRPEFIFHFLIDEQLGVGNNWRLAPYITSTDMLSDRAGWDPKLTRLLMANNPMEENIAIADIADESKATVLNAMTSDTHSWDRDVRELPMPYYTASFRGENHKTRFEVYFGLPVQEIADATANHLGIVEYGTSIFDDQWKPLFREHKEVKLTYDANSGFSNIYIHKSVFDLEAGTYHLSLFSKVKNAPRIGGWKVDADVSAFDGKRLNLSDIILAYDIHPSTADSSVFDRKDGLTVVPNPSKVYDLNKPVFLYYEIYNLTRRDGKTSFEVENKLTLMKKKKSGLGKLFGGGGKKKSLSIQDTRTGNETNSVEFATFDVSKLDAGEYRLTVRVKDLNSQQEQEKSIDLTLIRPE